MIGRKLALLFLDDFFTERGYVFENGVFFFDNVFEDAGDVLFGMGGKVLFFFFDDFSVKAEKASKATSEENASCDEVFLTFVKLVHGLKVLGVN